MMHDNIQHHGYDSDYDAIAPRSYIAPQEPKSGSRRVYFAIVAQDIFAIDRDGYEFKLEGELHAWMDGTAIDVMQGVDEQVVYKFTPIIAGIELIATPIEQQRTLFKKCFETPRGKAQLLELCRRANGE